MQNQYEHLRKLIFLIGLMTIFSILAVGSGLVDNMRSQTVNKSKALSNV